MAKRFPHFLRGTSGNEIPSNCIWFDTETKYTVGPDRQQYHYLWFGWACYQRRTVENNWSAPEWLRFETLDEFWSWVLSKCRAQTRLHLFSHNGAFDLPVMHAFTELPARGFELTSAVADAPPLILTWKADKRTIRFIDTLNFWRLPLKSIGESIGIPKLDMPSPTASTSEWDAYGRQDTEIIRVVVLRWFRFLTDNDLGGFAPTLASQAFTAYRHRFMPVKILIDDHERGTEISRDAYVGGRVECFKIGHFSGEFYLLDVNSMYPSVMRNGKFPHHLIGVYADPSVEELVKWMWKYSVIATVVIRTDEPAFPLVKDERLIFPVGEFVTTLCTSELKLAIEMDAVIGCTHAAVYHQAELFKGYVDFVHGQRLEARFNGDAVTDWLFKIMGNSLYGKWGQRGRRYEITGRSYPDEIEVWTDYDIDDGTVTHWRKFGGIVQQLIIEGEGFESFPAIAACICADARIVFWDALEQAGRENVYYGDTDSLVVNTEGLKRLAAYRDPNELGYWKLERELHDIEIYGPKDYRFDDAVKIKGIRKTAVKLSENVYSQDHFVGFRGLLRRGSLDAPIVHPVTKHLKREYLKGTIDANGDVSPFRLTLEAAGTLGITLWDGTRL